jgi:hypothetical protein
MSMAYAVRNVCGREKYANIFRYFGVGVFMELLGVP